MHGARRWSVRAARGRAGAAGWLGAGSSWLLPGGLGVCEARAPAFTPFSYSFTTQQLSH